MRKLIYEAYVSADGFATDKYGSTDFFDDLQFPDAAEAQQHVAAMEDIDTILLGAETYRMFARFWPSPVTEGDPVANMINFTPKVVVSNSLREAPWGGGPNVKIMPGQGVESVRKLKGEPGGDIIVWGSLSLTHDLLRAHLVDEIRLLVVPVALGEGRPIFPVGEPPLALTLLRARFFPSGVVRQCYSVGKQSKGPEEDPEEDIRRIITARMQTVACPDVDIPALEGMHSLAVSFNVIPPLRTERKPAALVEECRWRDIYRDPPECSVQDMCVKVGSTVAFAHFVYCLMGTLVTGEYRETWIRCTLGLEKQAGGWAIVHQHDSVPFNPMTNRAVVHGRC